MDMPTVS